MKVNSLIRKELEILTEKLHKESKNLADRLEVDGNINEKDLAKLRENPTFGRILYSLTRLVSGSDILAMSDEDMITHIRKVQQLETES